MQSPLISASVHELDSCRHQVPRSPGASQYTTSPHSEHAMHELDVTVHGPQVHVLEQVRLNVRCPHAPGQRSVVVPGVLGAHSP